MTAAKTGAPSKRLDGEVVLVTGSTAGLGRHIALAAAWEGAAVAVTGRNAERGKAVLTQITSGGGLGCFAAADLSAPEGPEQLVADVAARLGDVTVLVNNAVSPEAIAADTNVAELEYTTLLQSLTIGLMAPILLCKHVIPGMLRAGYGSIVNITATSGHVGVPGQAAYAAAKGGLEAVGRQICADFARRGVRANTVEPGYIIHERRDAGMSPARLEELQARRLARLATPDDVAEVVVFLASRASEVVVGVTVPVDGGTTAVRPSRI